MCMQLNYIAAEVNYDPEFNCFEFTHSTTCILRRHTVYIEYGILSVSKMCCQKYKINPKLLVNYCEGRNIVIKIYCLIIMFKKESILKFVDVVRVLCKSLNWLSKILLSQ